MANRSAHPAATSQTLSRSPSSNGLLPDTGRGVPSAVKTSSQLGIGVMLALGVQQSAIGPVGGEQCLVHAALDDPAPFQHDDLVAVPDRAQSVGDDDAGAAPSAEVVVDPPLGHRIERAG